MSKNNWYRIIVENRTSPSHRMKKITIAEAYSVTTENWFRRTKLNLQNAINWPNSARSMDWLWCLHPSPCEGQSMFPWRQSEKTPFLPRKSLTRKGTMSTCPALPRKPLNVNISKPDSGAHPTEGFCSRISNEDWLSLSQSFLSSLWTSILGSAFSRRSSEGARRRFAFQWKWRRGGVGTEVCWAAHTGPTVTMHPLASNLFARWDCCCKAKDCDATGVSHNHHQTVSFHKSTILCASNSF